MSESHLYPAIMKRATELNSRLLRNNIGMLKNEHGHLVKFGLANPGGSDLIGLTPIVVTPEMVGNKVALFTACEVKLPGQKLTQDQARFIEFVNSFGGIAFQSNGPDDFEETLSRIKYKIQSGK